MAPASPTRRSADRIEDSGLFLVRVTGLFFIRVVFDAGVPMDGGVGGTADLAAAFAPVAERFGMDWRLVDAAAKPRVLMRRMVSMAMISSDRKRTRLNSSH